MTIIDVFGYGCSILKFIAFFGIFSACIMQAQNASAQEMFTELNNDVLYFSR